MELFHLPLNELIIFSLTSSYRQTEKQANAIYWFHMKKKKSEIPKTLKAILNKETFYFGGPNLQVCIQFL